MKTFYPTKNTFSPEFSNVLYLGVGLFGSNNNQFLRLYNFLFQSDSFLQRNFQPILSFLVHQIYAKVLSLFFRKSYTRQDYGLAEFRVYGQNQILASCTFYKCCQNNMGLKYFCRSSSYFQYINFSSNSSAHSFNILLLSKLHNPRLNHFVSNPDGNFFSKVIPNRILRQYQFNILDCLGFTQNKNLVSESPNDKFSDNFVHRLFSSIMSLYFPSRPSAILMTIIAIYINAVNCSIFYAKLFYVSLVRFIHIFLKFLKGLPLAFYSSSTVIFELFIMRVITAIQNMRVFNIKSGISHSVFEKVFSGNSGSAATTGFSMTILQVMGFYQNFLSALTKTLPNRTSILDMRKTQDFQIVKFLTSYINQSAHNKSIARSVGRVKKGCGDNLIYQYA